MALSAEANITGLNHTLQQLISQLALYKLGNPRKVPKTENFNFLQVQNNMKTLIIGTEQHKTQHNLYQCI